MEKYLLVREKVHENKSYATLQAAREAQQQVPQGETSGIVRVSAMAKQHMHTFGLQLQYDLDADDEFVLLTMK